MRLKSVYRSSSAALALATAMAGFAAVPASADILQLYEGYFYQTTANTNGQVFGVAARNRADALPGTGNGVSVQASSWNQTAQQIANVTGGDGSGAIIAVIDSGIDLDNSEFTGRVLTGACFGDSSLCATPDNLVGGDEGIAPTNPTHGTFVASTAAGDTVGVAPGAWILPVRVCNTTSLSCPGDIPGAVIWAATTGNADIINMSLGGDFISSSNLIAAQTAIANGALMVVSAGNGGSRRTTSGSPAGLAIEDGVVGGMIVVGATGLGNQLTSFSETPGTGCRVSGTTRICRRDYYVVAPGQGIVAVGGGGFTGSVNGTSFSSPYVAGVAALVKGAAPYLTNYQIADIIFSTTIDLGAVGSDRVFGRGAVNAQAALDAVGISSMALSGTSTSGYSGSGDVRGARITGPVSQAIAGSRLLRSAVVLDKYTRDFRFDMTRGADVNGFSVFGMLGGGSAGFTPVAGSFGGVSFSAVVVEDTTMGIADPLMMREDRSRTDVFNAIASFSAGESTSVTLGFNTSMAGLGADYDLAASPAYDGLFMSASAMNSPYLRLADGGLYAGVAYGLTDTLTLRTSVASFDTTETEELPVSDQELKIRRVTHFETLEADHGADGVSVGLDWAFASWGGLGLSATSVTEYNAILGGEQVGALSIADEATTRAVTLQGRVSLGDGFILSGAWNEGTTSIDTPANGIFTNVDDLHSRTYGLAISKIGVFGNSDLLGFAVSRPLHIVGGSGELTIATDVNGDRTLVYGTEAINFGWDALQTDYELGYSATLMDGAVGFELNAAYQQNIGGFAGEDGVAFATRLGLQF